MCIGQITGGFITFIYQCTFLRKKGKNLEKKNSFQLIETKRKMNKIDNYFKILLSLFSLMNIFKHYFKGNSFGIIIF